MNNTLNYYRIKTEFYQEDSKGGLVKKRTEDLVHGANYSDAEKSAYALAHYYGRDQYSQNMPINIEITKTKINELLYNGSLTSEPDTVNGLICCTFDAPDESSVGMYAVKVMFIAEEDNGKEKRTNEIIYTPANSNTDAAVSVQRYLKQQLETREYVIREVKFDKAETILWTPETYREQTDSYNQR